MQRIRARLSGFLIVLASLIAMQIGGAGIGAPVSHLVPVRSLPAALAQGWFELMSAVEPEVSLPVRSLPPGCEIPRSGAACAVTAVAGGLDVPMDAYDLVPATSLSVEEWRPLVEHFFLAGDVDRALRVIACESHGDPRAANPRSSARGLFQHLGKYWQERTVAAGRAGAEIYDPVANVAVAAWLVYDAGGWSHWNPSRPCWRR